MNALIIGIAGYVGTLAFGFTLCRVAASSDDNNAQTESRRGLHIVGDQPMPLAGALMNPNPAA